MWHSWEKAVIKRTGIALLVAPVLLLGLQAGAETLVEEFRGVNVGETDPFTVEGPWRLDWEAKSDQPLMTAFYSNLYNADTGEFLGFITQLRGTGSGSKLIMEGGTFRIGVSGNNVEWTLEIVELSEAEAKALR